MQCYSPAEVPQISKAGVFFPFRKTTPQQGGVSKHQELYIKAPANFHQVIHITSKPTHFILTATMSTKFEGKVIALTGGGSGIGLETSKMLASRGATVCIADIQKGPLEAAAKDIESAGGKVTTTVLNVRDRKAVEDWIFSSVAKYGKLDGAVNLAGVIGKQIGIANIEDIEDDDWDFIMGVNTNGVLNCMRPEIKALTKGGNGGSIVNAASIAGIIGMEKNGAYIASKHAVVGLTRAAAKECGSRNIRVNCIAPVSCGDLLSRFCFANMDE